MLMFDLFIAAYPDPAPGIQVTIGAALAGVAALRPCWPKITQAVTIGSRKLQ